MGEHKTNPNAVSGRPACASCVHFFVDNGESGHCRRNPPLAMMVPTKNPIGQTVLALQSSYPPTMGDRWCGEHPEFTRWLLRSNHAASGAEAARAVQ